MVEYKYGCNGLVAVISGGTSGIGLATAQKLAADGAHVFILGRSKAHGLQALRELTAQQPDANVHYVCCDVRSGAACKQAMMEIGALLGRQDFSVDILINSAGIYEEKMLESVTEEEYANIFDTNVKGTLFLTQAAVKYMYGGGCIVNIASDAALKGNYGCPVYCASKGAVVALTRSLALDLAPHIRVNCICPADVATPLLERQLLAADESYSLEDMAAAYPLGRIGRADEIAHMICSVASPANTFMTGSVIAVDGGITA